LTRMLTFERLPLEAMDAVARIHREAFDAALPMLAGLHTPEEDRAFFRDTVFARCTVWGGSVESALVGFIAFREGWIDQLYIRPPFQGRSLGSSLLAIAKGAHSPLNLWTFQSNTKAQAFYERNGFQVIEETDGSRNEEQEPDMLYRWEEQQKA
jgi:putative acetyltransferase